MPVKGFVSSAITTLWEEFSLGGHLNHFKTDPIDFRTHINSLDQSGHNQGWYKQSYFIAFGTKTYQRWGM